MAVGAGGCVGGTAVGVGAGGGCVGAGGWVGTTVAVGAALQPVIASIATNTITLVINQSVLDVIGQPSFRLCLE